MKQLQVVLFMSYDDLSDLGFISFKPDITSYHCDSIRLCI